MMHAIITLLTGVFFYQLDLRLEGFMFMASFYIGREHAQAEYRWIESFGYGKRRNMPWWGGFDYRVWNAGSLLDWVMPILVFFVAYFAVSI